MSPVEILEIVALILISARICMIMMQRRQESGNQRPRKKKAHIPEVRIGTEGPDLLTVEQLDDSAKKAVCRFRITSIPGSGIKITRQSSDRWVINLREGMDCTATVRMPHAALARDARGFFLQTDEDCPMFFEGSKTDEVSITNGMVVYLDQQPLRFYTPRKTSHKSGR